MSNRVNLQLLDRAAEMLDYWEGTQWAERIEALINANDLDELHRVVTLAEGEASSQEFSRWQVTVW